ncbi:hypothetical protein [Xanthomonas arboricola]|uniref:hypothetical protein n=1 Tax=Xanthomonas arboricola TaxID=56448 RepID=UPI0012D2BED1|nr:hypothetical protein [Xanthomonas arboricola]
MIEFERSDSGLLVPEQPEPREKNPSQPIMFVNSVGLSTIVNLFMVLIQLATVWILWKTYQDTVIPNRQKELLSEQVAQLELEQNRRAKEATLAKQRLQALDTELSTRRDNLRQLAAERERLLAEATTAQASAERARLAEASARASATTAKSGLEASQWSIYYQSAASIVGLPEMIMIRKLGELERAGIGGDDPKAAFHTYLEGVERIWPDMDADAQMIVREIRKDESKLYLRWMIEEFATYFSKESRGLTCPRPNFAAVKADIDRKFDIAAKEAIAKKREEQQEKQAALAEAMKRRVEIPYTDSIKNYEIKVAISNATYKMVGKVEEDFRKSIETCNEKFDPIGDRFFESKGVSQPTLPSSVFEEFNK